MSGTENAIDKLKTELSTTIPSTCDRQYGSCWFYTVCQKRRHL